MHPLDGVNLKIVRAKEQIEAFHKEADQFLASDPKPYTIIEEATSQKPKYAYECKIHRPPPREWGVLVGEITYNIRSALDHLTWQLALLNAQEPSPRTEFPIFNEPDKYKNFGQGGTMSKLRDVPINARNIIETLQPFNRTEESQTEILWWIHQINRFDKHREIIPCFMQPIYKFSNLTGVYRPRKRVNDGDKIEITVIEGATTAHIGLEIAFEIPFFDSPFPAGRLDSMHKFVSDKVIPCFESFFK